MLSISVSMKQACGHLSDIPTEMTPSIILNCVSKRRVDTTLGQLALANLGNKPLQLQPGLPAVWVAG